MKKKAIRPSRGKYLTRTDFEKYLEQHVPMHTDLSITLNRVLTLVEDISMVQVNGRKGLQESLQDIYLATTSLRTNRKLFASLREWKDNSRIGKAIHTKLGKTIFTFSTIFIILSVLYVLGANSLNPIRLLSSLIELTIKLL